MVVIGFFQNVINAFNDLIMFVSKPLGEQFDIDVEPFASASIINLLGISLVATLGVLLTIHLVRLFIGG